MKNRARSLRVAATVCAALSLLMLFFTAATRFAPAEQEFGVKLLLLSASALAFWAALFVRSHRALRSGVLKGKLVPPRLIGGFLVVLVLITFFPNR